MPDLFNRAAHNLDTTFAAFRRPTLSRPWAASDGYFDLASNLICHWSGPKRCLLPTSAADFCCHEYPLDLQIPSLRLAPFRPPRPASCLHRRSRTSVDTKLSTTTSVGRCRRPRPWVVTQLTLRPPAAVAFIFPRGAPSCPGVDSRRLCRLATSPMRRLPTLPVATSTPSGFPSSSERARIRFTDTSP